MKKVIIYNIKKGASLQKLEIEAKDFQSLASQQAQQLEKMNVVEEKIFVSIAETGKMLTAELSRNIKKDKKDTIRNVLQVVKYLYNQKVRTSLLFEASRGSTTAAPSWNLGALVELLLNVSYDHYNGSIKNLYEKGAENEVDFTFEGVAYEVKFNSKYSAAAPKKNDILNIINVVSDNNGLRVELLKDNEVAYKVVKDGDKTKKVMLLQQPNAVQCEDLMDMLGL
jgi:hypothetical protein